MIDLKGYKGFVLLKNDNSKEAQAIMITCALQKIPYIRVRKNESVPSEYVPCGSIEWIESILGYHPTPDYYPSFLKQYLYRDVWKADKWPLDKKVFIKPADRYKRFNGRITIPGSYRGKKKGPYWCSDIIKFENEWRYYISNGKVLCGEWYAGDEENMPDALDISYKELWFATFPIGGRPLTEMEMLRRKGIHFPDRFCGAVDFGMTSEGKFALVESQHPYSCGWYGKDHEKYCQWVIDGWIYMNKK